MIALSWLSTAKRFPVTYGFSMLARLLAICRANHRELTVPHLLDSSEGCQRNVAIADGDVVTRRAHLQIFLVISPDRRREITRLLAPLKANLVFAGPTGETEAPILEDDIFQVAILPAALSDTAWWNLWGVLELLNRRPAILVYAREATFQLWAGVLECGGYDVIVEPFSGQEIRDAVIRAARSFEERSSNGL
jgi:hypothetical protein